MRSIRTSLFFLRAGRRPTPAETVAAQSPPATAAALLTNPRRVVWFTCAPQKVKNHRPSLGGMQVRQQVRHRGHVDLLLQPLGHEHQPRVPQLLIVGPQDLPALSSDGALRAATMARDMGMTRVGASLGLFALAGLLLHAVEQLLEVLALPQRVQ